MSEESTTPDPVELARQTFEAANRLDLDAVMSRCPPDVPEIEYVIRDRAFADLGLAV